jgi:hypothetical protein
MTGLKQPWLGIAATAMIIAIAFLAILPWDNTTFGGVFCDVLMCAIPFAALVGAFWHGEEPRVIAGLRQPMRGIAYLGLTGAVAVAVYVILGATIGGGKGATPFLAFGIILSVVVTFWLAIMWAGWPFTLITNKLLGGLALLVGAYIVTAALLRTFNFGFLAGTPFYPGMDPAGPVPAWDGLVVAVTCLATLFLFLHFELWPFTRFTAIRRQPILGIVGTGVVVAIGSGAYYLGTRALGMTPDTFLITVPVPFLFGSTVLLTMLGGSATARLTGLARGLVSAVLAMIIGSVLARGYLMLMPVLTRDVPPGDLDQHLWLASALLGVTFPFLAMYNDFFQLWPLAPKARSAAAPEVTGPANDRIGSTMRTAP